MEHYTVEDEGNGRFMIVARGEPPLPATFDSRATAQSVADRLNGRCRTWEGPGPSQPARKVGRDHG